MTDSSSEQNKNTEDMVSYILDVFEVARGRLEDDESIELVLALMRKGLARFPKDTIGLSVVRGYVHMASMMHFAAKEDWEQTTSYAQQTLHDDCVSLGSRAIAAMKLGEALVVQGRSLEAARAYADEVLVQTRRHGDARDIVQLLTRLSSVFEAGSDLYDDDAVISQIENWAEHIDKVESLREAIGSRSIHAWLRAQALEMRGHAEEGQS